jgi:hypothetical protein
MLCPNLRECFKQSINNKNAFFERERCTHEEEWSKCPVFLENQRKQRLMEKLASS